MCSNLFHYTLKCVIECPQDILHYARSLAQFAASLPQLSPHVQLKQGAWEVGNESLNPQLCKISMYQCFLLLFLLTIIINMVYTK